MSFHIGEEQRFSDVSLEESEMNLCQDKTQVVLEPSK